MKSLSKEINGCDRAALAQRERDGKYDIEVDGQKITLTIEDVEIVSEDIPGWSVAKEGNLTIALDVTITDELRAEGLARDLVNRVQNLRKDMGLEVQDKIAVVVSSDNSVLNQAVDIHNSYIKEEIQALSLNTADSAAGAQEFDLDGVTAFIAVEKV